MKKAVLIIFLIIANITCPLPVLAQYLPTVKTPEKQLEIEIQKMIEAGPLRTAYAYGPDFRYARNSYNQSDTVAISVQEFDDLFHNPADTLYTLTIAYPYLPDELYPGDTTKTWKQKLLAYMNTEYNTFQPYKNDHRGTSGTYREYNDVPQEVRNSYQSLYDIASGTPTNLTGFEGWSFNPFNYYALYKYAQVMGNALEILTLLTNNGHTKPGALPSDSILNPRPHVLNSYIAGYYGYKGLLQLAGKPADTAIESYLTSALQKKVQWLPLTFTDLYNMSSYDSGGFLWLVPELGDYLNQNARSKVNTIIEYQEKMTPYWMIPNVDEGHRLDNNFYNEGTLSPLYDESSLFLAKAYIQKQSKTELSRHLQNSGMYRGDLFFIQNLVATIQAGSGQPTISPTPTPTPIPGDATGDKHVNAADYAIWNKNYGTSNSGSSFGDFNNDGKVNGVDFIVWLSNFVK